MFKQEDLVDVIMEVLGPSVSASQTPAAPPEKKAAASRCAADAACTVSHREPLRETGEAREFLSEYELKKRVDWSRRQIRVPARTILSPLATEWINFKRIQVIKEG